MKIRDALKNLTRFEKLLWISSCILVTMCFFLGAEKDAMTLIATLTGVSALIFVAKGNVLGQLLTILFSLLYGVIAFRFRYYGEMITYLGMTAPIALLSAISWMRNPYEAGKGEVRVAPMTKGKLWLLLGLTAAVTVLFYWILKAFHTARLMASTVSVFTSFLASGLMFLRSPFYAVAYAGNDVVLIVLWVLASLENPAYISMVLCFGIFLVNDIYGYVNGKRMERKQAKNSPLSGIGD